MCIIRQCVSSTTGTSHFYHKVFLCDNRVVVFVWLRKNLYFNNIFFISCINLSARDKRKLSQTLDRYSEHLLPVEVRQEPTRRSFFRAVQFSCGEWTEVGRVSVTMSKRWQEKKAPVTFTLKLKTSEVYVTAKELFTGHNNNVGSCNFYSDSVS